MLDLQYLLFLFTVIQGVGIVLTIMALMIFLALDYVDSKKEYKERANESKLQFYKIESENGIKIRKE